MAAARGAVTDIIEELQKEAKRGDDLFLELEELKNSTCLNCSSAVEAYHRTMQDNDRLLRRVAKLEDEKLVLQGAALERAKEIVSGPVNKVAEEKNGDSGFHGGSYFSNPIDISGAEQAFEDDTVEERVIPVTIKCGDRLCGNCRFREQWWSTLMTFDPKAPAPVITDQCDKCQALPGRPDIINGVRLPACVNREFKGKQ